MTKKLEHIEETIDTTTGEIKTLRKTFSIKSKNTEEFFLTFLSGLNAICNLSRPRDIKVLAILCSMAEFNTGRVTISSSKRKEILEKLDFKSPQAFTNSIARLKEAQLVTGERGAYEIDPQFFWKGTTNERLRLLQEKRVDIKLKYTTDE